jgi:hypothetical protein
MRRIAELLFGKAAVVGALSMIGHPRPIRIEIEIDPYTGRETLLSLITRRQNMLAVAGTLTPRQCDIIKREWECAHRTRQSRVIILSASGS